MKSSPSLVHDIWVMVHRIQMVFTLKETWIRVLQPNIFFKILARSFDIIQSPGKMYDLRYFFTPKSRVANFGPDHTIFKLLSTSEYYIEVSVNYIFGMDKSLASFLCVTLCGFQVRKWRNIIRFTFHIFSQNVHRSNQWVSPSKLICEFYWSQIYKNCFPTS